MDKGGERQDFPSKIFCLTVPNSFVGELFSFSLISGTEKVWMSGGGASGFSVEYFLSHSAENFLRGILYSCKNFGYGKSLDKGGSITIFCRSFCLTLPKYFNGEHFGVSEIFFYRKFSCIGGGHRGFVGTFCLTGPKRKVL